MHQQLSRVLQANALFSLATGVLLTIVPGAVGGWLGVSIDGWLRLLGIGLICHCVLLWCAQARDDLRFWAQLNLIAIAPYPFAMIALVAFGLVDRDPGRVLVLVDGLVVGCLAWGHWRQLRTHRPAAVSTAS